MTLDHELVQIQHRVTFRLFNKETFLQLLQDRVDNLIKQKTVEQEIKNIHSSGKKLQVEVMIG